MDSIPVHLFICIFSLPLQPNASGILCMLIALAHGANLNNNGHCRDKNKILSFFNSFSQFHPFFPEWAIVFIKFVISRRREYVLIIMASSRSLNVIFVILWMNERWIEAIYDLSTLFGLPHTCMPKRDGGEKVFEKFSICLRFAEAILDVLRAEPFFNFDFIPFIYQ